jgi:hypothetical protein
VKSVCSMILDSGDHEIEVPAGAIEQGFGAAPVFKRHGGSIPQEIAGLGTD